MACSRDQVLAALDHRSQVFGCRTAASAHDVHAELGDEPFEMIGELLWGEVVVHGTVDN